MDSIPVRDSEVFFFSEKRSFCQHEHFFYSYFQAEDIYTTTTLLTHGYIEPAASRTYTRCSIYKNQVKSDDDVSFISMFSMYIIMQSVSRK